MKIINVCFVYDEDLATEEQLLKRYYTTVGWAESLQKKGIEVIVVQRFIRDYSFKRNDVQYHFIRDRFSGRLKPSQLPIRFLHKLSKLDADVVHVHSTLFTPLLRWFLHKKTAIVVQNHGGPRLTGIRGIAYRLMDNVADGLFFTTVEQGKDWYRTRKLQKKIMPVMEGANSFNYHERAYARRITQMKGNPIFIWVGHLNENKDPLTVLGGFSELSKKYPEARLYMLYSSGKLLNEVKAKIGRNEDLQQSVILIGKVVHEQMEMYYNSADYFVLGSHAEGSGYSLSEAMACGCIPIVTDIPSFRMMTDDGNLGALWQTGNKDSFIEAATRAMNKSIIDESKACRDFYNQNLSFDAIAESSILHYERIIHCRP